MGLWLNVLVVVHVLVALSIIGLVLLQHGKGADMGSGFGGGASGSLFGATGSANFLSRSTAVLAGVFFALSLALTWVAMHNAPDQGGVMDTVRQQQEPAKDVPRPEAPSLPQSAAPKAPAAGAAQPAPTPEQEKEKQVPQ